MSKENNGFMACPFCGRTDKVVVLDEHLFYKLQGKYGTAAVSVECKRCSVDVYEHTSAEKNYEKRLELMRQKWNKRAAMPQETEGGESNE